MLRTKLASDLVLVGLLLVLGYVIYMGLIQLGEFLDFAFGIAAGAVGGYWVSAHRFDIKRWGAWLGLSKEPETVIEMEPLPHKHGHRLLPDYLVPDADFDPGVDHVIFQDGGPYSDKKAEEASNSQIWTLRYVNPGREFSKVPRKIPLGRHLLVLFGVVRVKVKAGEAENCHIRGEYRVGPDGKWKDAGELDWYSDRVMKRIMSSVDTAERIRRDPQRGIAYLFENTVADIPVGIDADIPLFHMIAGEPSVFLNGTIEKRLRGVSEAHPASFDFRVTLWARGYDPRKWGFNVIAAWDEFSITPLPPEPQPSPASG